MDAAASDELSYLSVGYLPAGDQALQTYKVLLAYGM